MGNILFVDDEAMLLELGTTLLETLGYQVMGNSSSIEAWQAFEEGKRWDLYIFDNSMPGFTGLELAQKVLAIEPKSSIIIISGYLGDELESFIESTPQVSFLQKPFRRQDISSLIEAKLGS